MGSRIGSVFFLGVVINTTKLVDVCCYMCFLYLISRNPGFLSYARDCNLLLNLEVS